MRNIFLLCICIFVIGCNAGLEKHMNATMARYIQKVHVACEQDTDCVAVMLSCRYPEWGYTAINRMELADLNRIREADWYTRCERIPDTSHIKTWCDGGRCRLEEEKPLQSF